MNLWEMIKNFIKNLLSRKKTDDPDDENNR